MYLALEDLLHLTRRLEAGPVRRVRKTAAARATARFASSSPVARA